MTRVFNFSAGPAALPEAGAAPGRRRDARLARQRHVGDGDEPPRQGVHRHPRRGRSAAARAAGDPGQLQGALHAGRRDRRERDRADEHAARQGERRLHRHRRVVEEVDHRGEASTPRSTSPPAARRAASPASRRARRWKLDPDAAYVHICANETIGGVEYHWTPDTGDVPLVADMSRNILSRPVDVAQLRPDLRRRAEEHRPGGPDDRHRPRRPDRPGALPITPSAFDYKQQADNDSMLNTPPTYAIYIAGLVFKWIKARAAWRRWPSTTAPRRRCCTTTSTAARFYSQPGRARRPLADERAVQAAATRRSTTPS